LKGKILMGPGRPGPGMWSSWKRNIQVTKAQQSPFSKHPSSAQPPVLQHCLLLSPAGCLHP
jgi:hypothetical protein